MIKKEMIAMLLAGGQGSRLGVLTAKVAKPAVAFGGKYKIIDFPLSNCINSGIDTVGINPISAIKIKRPHRNWYSLGFRPKHRRCYGSTAIRKERKYRMVHRNSQCYLPEPSLHGKLQSGICADSVR